MNMSFEDQIRERAYHMWLAGGMADGQAHEHWLSAERAVRSEVTFDEPEIILTKAPARKTAAAKTTKAASKPAKAVAKSATVAKTAKPATAVRASKAKKAELSASA